MAGTHGRPGPATGGTGGRPNASWTACNITGLHWDGPVLWQSQRDSAYRDTLAQLDGAGHLFHCDCTRALLGPDGACGGRCQPRQATLASPFSTRVKVPRDTRIEFTDQIQGRQREALGLSLPDFVLLRKDGLIAYQLAVVVDDAAQGITHVVRGTDLLDSTGRQIFLQQLLDAHTPAYCHLPVITNAQGQKLSKQNQAPALDDERAPQNLREALRFLGQVEPPPELADVAALLQFATSHWAPGQIPSVLSIPGDRIAAAEALYRPPPLQ